LLIAAYIGTWSTFVQNPRELGISSQVNKLGP
jgi:hypothetical protein